MTTRVGWNPRAISQKDRGYQRKNVFGLKDEKFVLLFSYWGIPGASCNIYIFNRNFEFHWICFQFLSELNKS